MGDENRGSAQSSRRRAPAAHSQIFPYLLVWAAVGTGVPLVLLLLDRVAGPVPLPVSETREGDTNIAPPSSIVDPGATVRSRFIGQAAIARARAATGV